MATNFLPARVERWMRTETGSVIYNNTYIRSRVHTHRLVVLLMQSIFKGTLQSVRYLTSWCLPHAMPMQFHNHRNNNHEGEGPNERRTRLCCAS
jgi:hypothetical protein